MFLLVPAHPGCPGQFPQSRKTVVCVCVCVCSAMSLTYRLQQKKRVGINNLLVTAFNKFCQILSDFDRVQSKELRERLGRIR